VMAAVGIAGPRDLDLASQVDAVVEAADELAERLAENGIAYAA
jgi:hypothetical protein